MIDVALARPADLARSEVIELYAAVGWTAYTREPEALMRSLDGSHRLVAARQDGRLAGLARSVSDGVTVVYVQDILVEPRMQGSGVGRALMETLLDSYGDIRQAVLLTDTDEAQRAFYERLGFTEVHDHAPELRAFVRLR